MRSKPSFNTFRTYNSRLIKSGIAFQIDQFIDTLTAALYRHTPMGLYFWKKRLSALESYPTQINIEVTSICNAKCVMCPRHLIKRRMEAMPMVLYKIIVDEARIIGTKQFVLTGYGEIFTSKRYKEFITYLAQQIPDALIRVVTNGSLLDEEAAQFLIDSKIFRVDISIDGTTKETYEAIRKNLRFEQVLNNTRRFIELKKQRKAEYPKIRLNIVAQKENEHELQQFAAMWKDQADYIGEHFLLSRLGMVDNGRSAGESYPCVLPWLEVNVWSNGDVVLCSDDWDGMEVMGNVKNQSILDIWRGEKFRRYRELHQSGKANQVGACSKCSSFRKGPSWFQSNRLVASQAPQLLEH
jgi:radical SAM protein with 4Fe4S-binding SPASM domain